MNFTMAYAEIESLLADLNGIGPEWASAFRSRLRLFKRFGFPPGVNTGKGRHVRYGPRELLFLAIAIDLLQMGIKTEQAASLLLASKDVVYQAANLASAEESQTNPVFLIVESVSLTAAWLELKTARLSDVEQMFRRSLLIGGSRRWSLIDASSLISDLARRLCAADVIKAPCDLKAALADMKDDGEGQENVDP